MLFPLDIAISDLNCHLRMDFTNHCNVGYGKSSCLPILEPRFTHFRENAAFVNFIGVEDLLYFARQKLGTKWYLSLNSLLLA